MNTIWRWRSIGGLLSSVRSSACATGAHNADCGAGRGKFLGSLRSISTLKGDDRIKALEELKKRGWKLQDGRDAIQKQFMFTDFTEVPLDFI